METLVKYFIGDLQKGNTKPSDFFIAVPTDVTEVEKGRSTIWSREQT